GFVEYFVPAKTAVELVEITSKATAAKTEIDFFMKSPLVRKDSIFYSSIIIKEGYCFLIVYSVSIKKYR
ncbi:MAG: hypothetical protein IKN34_00120, partial [Treponema sp.]|nr:hypothetical protein [Treponema sp.]